MVSNYDFLVEAISTPTDDCLVWGRGKFGNGYGAVAVDGKMRSTHRVALELTKPAPAGKVCSIRGEWVPGHKLHAAHGPCHNELCFNPQHLSWATRAENSADRERDGTHIGNEDHGRCVISDADVALIRSLWEGPYRGPNRTGPTQTELAERFGCTRVNIGLIVRGRTRPQAV